jgi:hypothetical protein
MAARPRSFGAFAANGTWLARALRDEAPVTDDLPMMEYGPIYRNAPTSRWG